MRSRLRVAASTGLVTSGLFIAGIGGALALADPDRGHTGAGQDSAYRGDRDGHDHDHDHDRDGRYDHRPRGWGRHGWDRHHGPGGHHDPDGPSGHHPTRSGGTRPPHHPPTKPSGSGTPTKSGEPTEPSGTPDPSGPPTTGSSVETTDSTTKTTSSRTTTTKTTTTKTTTTKTTTTKTTSSSATTTSPGLGEPPGGGGGDGPQAGIPPFEPPGRPEVQLPLPPTVASTAVVASAVPGLPAAIGAPPPVLPVIVAPVIVPPIVAPIDEPHREHGSHSGPGVGPHPKPTSKLAVGNAPPGAVGFDAQLPAASYRIGYADYLRTANTMELLAVALPGAGGLAALTGLGGLVGYRQAKAGRGVRIDAARFMK